MDGSGFISIRESIVRSDLPATNRFDQLKEYLRSFLSFVSGIFGMIARYQDVIRQVSDVDWKSIKAQKIKISRYQLGKTLILRKKAVEENVVHPSSRIYFVGKEAYIRGRRLAAGGFRTVFRAWKLVGEDLMPTTIAQAHRGQAAQLRDENQRRKAMPEGSHIMAKPTAVMDEGNRFAVLGVPLAKSDLWTELGRSDRSIESKLNLLLEAAKGILEFSEYGVHHDVHAANFLIGFRDQVWLSDFDQATTLKEAHRGGLEDKVGRFDIRSPEVNFMQAHGPKADVYSFGMMVYNESGIPLRSCKGLAELISQCISQNPEERPTPQQLVDRLQAILKPTSAPKVGEHANRDSHHHADS